MRKHVYIDTSWLIRISFEDTRRDKGLRRYETIFSSDLLCAELFSFARRENVDIQSLNSQLEAITWIIPDRSLRPEIEKVISAGYLRGADLWHLACACYLAPKADLTFLSADERQRVIAHHLGFNVLP